ncbi:unnamed protein product [Schistocephalus solidus]|uniref:Coiled-coil domain containing 180 n=1 Tax=Schistocephalus solidus TaxID=70667 RepID=A0A183SR85_SCHSO|nr:unnamed protein product [Schistocephalus solidus]
MEAFFHYRSHFFCYSYEKLRNIPSPFDCKFRGYEESGTTGGNVSSIVSADFESSEQFIFSFMRELERRTQQDLPALKCLGNFSNSPPASELLDEKHRTQDETNIWDHLLEFAYKQWNELVLLASHKQHAIQMAERFSRLAAEQENCLKWVEVKQEVLLTTGNDVTDVREVIRMECRMSDWESDLKALTGSVESCLEELDSLKEALSQTIQATSEGAKGMKTAKRAVKEWQSKLQGRWNEFMLLLEEHKKKLDVSLALQNVLQEAEEMNLWLRSKQRMIASLEMPITISDIDEQTSIYQNLLRDLEHTEGKISTIQDETCQIVHAQETTIAEAVHEKLGSVVKCWTELRRFCQQNLLELTESRQTQPSLEHICRQLKLQNEVLTSVRAMSAGISQILSAAAEAKIQDKVRQRAENLKNRFRQVQVKAEGVLAILQFHLLEKEKHQQLESMEEWISERQAVVNAQFVVTGTSIKQQKTIQKYHLLRNFEAEVDSYGHLAERIFREAEEVIKEYPEHSTSLAQALQRNAELWANLKITLSSQGSTLVKIYRAIIFSEGCEELMEWLGKASLKIFSIARSHHLGQKGTAFEILLDLNQEPHQAAQSYLRSRLSTSLKRSASDTCVIFLPEKPLDHSDKCDLSNISSSLSKVTDLNVQLNNKWIFFQELQNESQLAAVSSKFTGIQQKINACLADLTAQHNVINALRMLAGETAWLEERRAQIKWDLVGSLLLETEKLLLRHHNFAKEVAIRKLRGQPIIAKVLTWIQLAEATKVAAAPQERNEDKECAILLAHTPHLLVELMDRVSRLLWMQCLVETKLHSRYDTLEHWRSFFSHQIDLIETYNWLAETESAVMTESHASSGVASARAAIIKHSFVENTISTLQASRVRSLGQKTCQLLATIKHRMRLNKERLSALKRVSQDLPAESGQSEAAKRRRHQLRRCIHALERSATKMLTSQQSLQRQFKDLLDLVWEKKHRLRELLALNRLYEDVADLEVVFPF